MVPERRAVFKRAARHFATLKRAPLRAVPRMLPVVEDVDLMFTLGNCSKAIPRFWGTGMVWRVAIFPAGVTACINATNRFGRSPLTNFNRVPHPGVFDEKLRNLMERGIALKQAVAESKRRAQFKRDWDKLPSVPSPFGSSEALKDRDEPVQSPENLPPLQCQRRKTNP